MTFDFADLVVAVLGAALGWLAAARSYRLDAASAAADWLHDLRQWASEAIDVLAEAAYQTAQVAVLEQCRLRLSALIDRGRLFLPNKPDPHGTEKPPAYRGYRHAALDALVAAEQVLGGSAKLYDFPDRTAALIGLRREFVSMIQGILDPRSTNRLVVRWLKQSAPDRDALRRAEESDLLPDLAQVPPGAQRLMQLASARFVRERGPRRTTPIALGH